MKKILFSISFFIPASILLAEDLTFRLFVGRVYATFVDQIVIVMVGAIMILFMYKMAMSIFSEGSKKQSSRDGIVWSFVALFIMFSIWGIITMLKNSFDLNESSDTVYTKYQNVNYQSNIDNSGIIRIPR